MGCAIPRAPARGTQEAALLAALAAGDRAAAERLVEESTYRGVYAFLRRLCGDSELAARSHPGNLPAGLGIPWPDFTAEHGSRPGSAASPTTSSSTTCAGRGANCRLAERLLETAVDPSPAVDESLGQSAEADRLRRAVVLLPEEANTSPSRPFTGASALGAGDRARGRGEAVLGDPHSATEDVPCKLWRAASPRRRDDEGRLALRRGQQGGAPPSPSSLAGRTRRRRPSCWSACAPRSRCTWRQRRRTQPPPPLSGGRSAG